MAKQSLFSACKRVFRDGISGTYTVGEPAFGEFRVNAEKSYVQKFANNMQSRHRKHSRPNGC